MDLVTLRGVSGPPFGTSAVEVEEPYSTRASHETLSASGGQITAVRSKRSLRHSAQSFVRMGSLCVGATDNKIDFEMGSLARRNCIVYRDGNDHDLVVYYRTTRYAVYMKKMFLRGH